MTVLLPLGNILYIGFGFSVQLMEEKERGMDLRIKAMSGNPQAVSMNAHTNRIQKSLKT